MQANTKKGLIVTAVIAGLATAAYFIFRHSKQVTKLDMVQFIILNPKTVVSQNTNGFQKNIKILMGFGDDYISAWYNALQNGEATFMDKGNTISVQTGTAV